MQIRVCTIGDIGDFFWWEKYRSTPAHRRSRLTKQPKNKALNCIADWARPAFLVLEARRLGPCCNSERGVWVKAPNSYPAICATKEMSSLPHHQRSLRPWNDLHHGILGGSTEILVALLSDESIDIDQVGENGLTPLMLASLRGHSPAVRLLLDKGANLLLAADGGFTALHSAAQEGYLAISKMLVDAGADLEAKTSATAATPLFIAAEKGHLGVMSVLIEAGANPDSRSLDGATPLYRAAQRGRMDVIKMLLRGKANPLLTWMDSRAGKSFAPLTIAAQNGHSGVVRELVQQFGIEGCGGASRGVDALAVAAMNQHMDTMAVLTDAGVVDSGLALINAIGHGSELPVKFLLQQRKGDEANYLNYPLRYGNTPLVHTFGFGGVSSPSPRIMRLLVNAEADTSSAVRRMYIGGEVEFNGTLLTLAHHMLREKKVDGKAATEDQLNRLEGIRRLLLQVEAVHAVSWIWPIVDTDTEGTSRKVTASTPLRRMLPIFRRRAERPRVLLAALFRWVG